MKEIMLQCKLKKKFKKTLQEEYIVSCSQIRFRSLIQFEMLALYLRKVNIAFSFFSQDWTPCYKTKHSAYYQQ